jgi:hypothetical protein
LGQETEKLRGLWQVAQAAGWWLPHRKICWISERHDTLHRNPQGRLHKDGAMALSYPDGWGIYALNGLQMKPEYVLTRAEELSPDVILAEQNTDIRRELIRKVGVERMLAKLPHRVLDKQGDYEVLSVDLGETVRDARYLKMLNPSIGTWHIEGIDPQRVCNTVEKAINWRNSHWFANAEVLT